MIATTRMPALAAGLALVLAGCNSAQPPQAHGTQTTVLDLSGVRIVDLTYPVDESTLYWPTAPHGFQYEELFRGETEAGFHFYAGMFSMPEHLGTHMDAPAHFGKGEATLGEIGMERLIVPAVVIDARDEAAGDRDYALTRERLEAFEAEHGRIAPNTAVLLNTGWSRHWNDPEAFLGDDPAAENWRPSFPSFGEEAARLLVERDVALIGTDTASIDPGRSETYPVHQLTQSAGIPGLENLANLAELPPTGAWLIALPAKIAPASGGPVRAVALVPR